MACPPNFVCIATPLVTLVIGLALGAGTLLTIAWFADYRKGKLTRRHH